jgi:hypothetical protein
MTSVRPGWAGQQPWSSSGLLPRPIVVVGLVLVVPQGAGHPVRCPRETSGATWLKVFIVSAIWHVPAHAGPLLRAPLPITTVHLAERCDWRPGRPV